MTYPETIEYLYSLRWFGTKLGLTHTLRLAELAGNPHERLRFIHVAGTNGKGSTCAMLEGIYRAAGLRVGLFTSPHLVAFSERIQVNRRPIPEPDVVRLVDRLRPLLGRFGPEEHPTFFEVVTILALLYFEEQGCELAVWETGLGGRLDATNIVTPLASLITNVQYDHQKWLGETIPSIAREKAGIIKPGVPVLSAAQELEAVKVIEETAARNRAPLTFVSPAAAARPPLDRLRLPLLGQHQRLNAALALATVRKLRARIPVPDEAIERGLAKLQWPGRLQVVARPSGQRLLLDGAHNPGGAQTLADALREHFPGAKPALVLGILQDKDWPSMCRLLAPLASRIVLVPVHSERTAEPHALAEACRAANPRAAVVECASLAEALENTALEEFVAVAGSLYLVGEAMELLHVAAEASLPERGLNEWGPPR